MKTKHPTQSTVHKLALDQKLLQNLKEIGIVSNIADLNRQMGRNETYFACMRNRGYSLHIGSLVFLAAKYSSDLNASDCVRTRAKYRAAVTAINEIIQAKCELRQQELLSQ
jgi:hypothetical protein